MDIMMIDFYLFSALYCLNLWYRRRYNNFLSNNGDITTIFILGFLSKVGLLCHYMDELKYTYNYLTFNIHFASTIVLICWMIKMSARENRYCIYHLMGYITTPFFWINLIEYVLTNLTAFYYYHFAVSSWSICVLVITYLLVILLLVISTIPTLNIACYLLKQDPYQRMFVLFVTKITMTNQNIICCPVDISLIKNVWMNGGVELIGTDVFMGVTFDILFWEKY